MYSLRGKGVAFPITATAGNFIYAVPLTLISLSLWLLQAPSISTQGVLLALASGGITSGMGYALWYWTFRGYTATSAAIVQLAVPIIAAAMGIVFLSEVLSMRLVISGVVTLGGVGVALWAKK